MPRGEYHHDDGTIEAFTSAPGPMGWRYYATRGAMRLDLSVDARGRSVRVRIEDGSHALLLVRRGEAYEGYLDGAEVALEPPAWFDFPSPGFLAVALHARTEGGIHDVIALDPLTLTPRPARRTVERAEDGTVTTAVGAFDARRWIVEGRTIWIADTVAVAGDGFDLRAYERGATGPATRLRSL